MAKRHRNNDSFILTLVKLEHIKEDGTPAHAIDDPAIRVHPKLVSTAESKRLVDLYG